MKGHRRIVGVSAGVVCPIDAPTFTTSAVTKETEHSGRYVDQGTRIDR